MNTFPADYCAKCHFEDDRCDHRVPLSDKIILNFVDSMPRFSQGNSVNRYGMYLVFRDAVERRIPTDQSDYQPKQVKREVK